MRIGSVVQGSIGRVACGCALRRIIFVAVLTFAAGTSLSTSAVALAMPLGPWLPNPPANISAPGNNNDPQIAVGPDGTTTIIWTDNDRVQASTRAAGAAAFSTPINVSPSVTEPVYSPHIAVGPDGTTTIAWLNYSINGAMIRAATRAAGATTFSAPIDVSQIVDGHAVIPSPPGVVAGPDGITTITWYQPVGDHYVVQAATRAAGATRFSTPVDLGNSGTLTHMPSEFPPAIAVGPNGKATIAWIRESGDTNEWAVMAATRSAGAEPFSTPVELDMDVPPSYVQVAAGPDGTTTVIWSGSNCIKEATRAAGALNFNAASDVSCSGESLNLAHVAIGADDTTIITWFRGNGIVQASMRAPGASTFGRPINVSSTNPGADAELPQVAIGPDGATTITWLFITGTYLVNARVTVQAATRAAGSSTFGEPLNLSTPSPTGYSWPLVAVGPDDTTTVIWSDGDTVQAVTATPPPSVLTVTKTGNGTVTSKPAFIDCGSTCTATLANLTRVALTATAAADSTFTGWSGDCTGTSTCTVSMTEARNVTATFTLKPHAPPTTPTHIHWTTGTRTTNQPITSSFTAAPDTTYTITATSNANRSLQTRATRTARGTCTIKTSKKTHKRTATCTIRLRHAGTWLVKITPTENGLVGTPATKTIKIHTPPPTHKPQPAEPITG